MHMMQNWTSNFQNIFKSPDMTTGSIRTVMKDRSFYISAVTHKLQVYPVKRLRSSQSCRDSFIRPKIQTT